MIIEGKRVGEASAKETRFLVVPTGLESKFRNTLLKLGYSGTERMVLGIFPEVRLTAPHIIWAGAISINEKN